MFSELGGPTLNHGCEVGNLIIDYLVSVVLSVPIVWVFRRLLEGGKKRDAGVDGLRT